MRKSLTLKTINATLLVASAGFIQPAYAEHHDSLAISGAILFRSTFDAPVRDLYVGFKTGAYAPIFADDGKYSSSVYAAATVGSGVYLYPLVLGNVTSAFDPLVLQVGLYADVNFPPDPEYRNFAFSSTNSASVSFSSDDLKPEFRIDSAIDADLSFYLLKFHFPLMEYHYSNKAGTQKRSLGLELNLLSDDKNCQTEGCLYTTGFWTYKLGTIPEPATNILMLSGMALVVASRSRRFKLRGKNIRSLASC